MKVSQFFQQENLDCLKFSLFFFLIMGMRFGIQSNFLQGVEGHTTILVCAICVGHRFSGVYRWKSIHECFSCVYLLSKHWHILASYLAQMLKTAIIGQLNCHQTRRTRNKEVKFYRQHFMVACFRCLHTFKYLQLFLHISFSLWWTFWRTSVEGTMG